MNAPAPLPDDLAARVDDILRAAPYTGDYTALRGAAESLARELAEVRGAWDACERARLTARAEADALAAALREVRELAAQLDDLEDDPSTALRVRYSTLLRLRATLREPCAALAGRASA